MIRRVMLFVLLLAAVITTGLEFVASSDVLEDEEYINFVVARGFYKRNHSSSGYKKFHCPGKMVPHPKSGEGICICPRGQGFVEVNSGRDSYSYCKDCKCEEGQFTCSFFRAYKTCYCESGYEFKYNGYTCVRKPCLNGGTSWERVDLKNYICSCLPGYTGRNCETALNSCEDNRCQNEGICYRGKGKSYWCDCPPTHTGRLCETEIHKCDRNPCWYGGTCYRGNGTDYICSCPETHTGTNCETEINPCDPNPCKNGECYRGPGLNYLCKCAPGFVDKNCSRETSTTQYLKTT